MISKKEAIDRCTSTMNDEIKKAEEADDFIQSWGHTLAAMQAYAQSREIAASSFKGKPNGGSGGGEVVIIKHG